MRSPSPPKKFYRFKCRVNPWWKPWRPQFAYLTVLLNENKSRPTRTAIIFDDCIYRAIIPPGVRFTDYQFTSDIVH